MDIICRCRCLTRLSQKRLCNRNAPRIIFSILYINNLFRRGKHQNNICFVDDDDDAERRNYNNLSGRKQSGATARNGHKENEDNNKKLLPQ